MKAQSQIVSLTDGESILAGFFITTEMQVQFAAIQVTNLYLVLLLFFLVLLSNKPLWEYINRFGLYKPDRFLRINVGEAITD